MKPIIRLLIALLLAACSASPDTVLPTVAELPTLTATAPATETLIPTWTATFTESPTPAPAATDTPTVTPSATITDTPSPTATDTPSPTPDVPALGELLQLALEATVLPVTVIAAPVVEAPPPIVVTAPTSCAVLPAGGFATFFAAEQLIQQIGCPQGTPLVVEGAWQEFEGGWMLWLAGPIYTLHNGGQFQRFEDSFDPALDPESGGEAPPQGRVQPVRGFGKVWRENAQVRQRLGWAFGGEAAGQITYQRFDNGLMLAIPARTQIIVLAGNFDGTWRSFVGSY